MKTYTFAKLKALARQDGYKMLALENHNGDRIVPFNQYKKTGNLDSQFRVIETRLKSEVQPDGVYFILLAHTITAARNPDRFCITKGKVNADELEKTVLPITKTETVYQNTREAVLSLEKFFEMQKEISDLNSENARLKFELNAALKELEEMEEEEGLSEGDNKLQNVGSMIKESIATILPLADRYFDQQEKKLDLEKMKMEMKMNGGGSNGSDNSNTQRKEVIPGSQEHLNIIEYYYKSDKEGSEDKLNIELDKLEAANPELYKQVLTSLGMSEEQEEGKNAG